MNTNIREEWEKVKDNKRYCTELECWNSGGNVILTEMPIEYDGMDCLLLLDEHDCLTIYLNRDFEEADCPYYVEFIVREFDSSEPIPEEIKEYAKQLMAEKIKYYKVRGYDYKKYLENDYTDDWKSLYDMVENFNPNEKEEVRAWIENQYGEEVAQLEVIGEDEFQIDGSEWKSLLPIHLCEGDMWIVKTNR